MFVWTVNGVITVILLSLFGLALLVLGGLYALVSIGEKIDKWRGIRSEGK